MANLKVNVYVNGMWKYYKSSFQHIKIWQHQELWIFKKRKIQQFENLTGKRFGKLNIVKYSHKEYNKKTQNYTFYYICKCNCGNKIVKSDRYLKYTKVPSCGCHGLKKLKETHPKQYDYIINTLGMGKVLDFINVKY